MIQNKDDFLLAEERMCELLARDKSETLTDEEENELERLTEEVWEYEEFNEEYE